MTRTDFIRKAVNAISTTKNVANQTAEYFKTNDGQVTLTQLGIVALWGAEVLLAKKFRPERYTTGTIVGSAIIMMTSHILTNAIDKAVLRKSRDFWRKEATKEAINN